MTRRWRPDDVVWLVLILSVALLVRLWGIGTWQWEQDELYTLRDARDLGATANGAPGIRGRPLYYLLQHALLLVFPATPLTLRLPAMAFGLLGIAAVWWSAGRIFGPRAALVAAALAALSPWHLQASQFARYWTLVFLAAAVAFGLLAAPRSEARPGRLLLTLGVLLIGSLSHPTFLFPVVGFAAGLHLVRDDGRFGLRLPTRPEWAWLWIPFIVIIGAFYLALSLTGNEEAIRNQTERGLLASLRLIPAMLQWAPVEFAGAAVLGAAYLFLSRTAADRRWAVAALGGATTALVLLFGTSFFTGVYADYGISVLPLAVITAGGFAQRISDLLPEPAAGGFVAMFVGILGLAAAPGVVSHLSDGSRFDYRTAYQAIAHLGPDRPVAGGIEVLARAYAPDLPPTARPGDLARAGTGFWFIASYQRYGIRGASPRLKAWLDANCRRVVSSERPRFDYRVHRVELLWCGTPDIPSGPGQ
jgi:hypothetical protein